MQVQDEDVSTHLIFGRNLRQLCKRVGTIAEVAEHLDVNRVQMNRILNGESFPKPGLMKRICDYFQVDARILLQPLAELEDGAPSRLNPNTRMAAALDYALYGQDFTVSAEDEANVIPDGLHLLLRPSFLWRDTIWVSMVRFFSQNDVRLVRGIDPVAKGMKRSDAVPIRSREFRGAVTRSTGGISFIYTTNIPNSTLGVDHFTLRSWRTYGFLTGRCMFMSPSNPIDRSVVPCILQPLEQNTHEILRMSRLAGFRDLSEVPSRYHSTLLAKAY